MSETVGVDAQRYDLPDGRSVLCIDPTETATVWTEISDEGTYAGAVHGLVSGDVVLDIGAHIGMASLYFSDRVRNARILAFEPAPKTFHCLQENLSRHAPDAQVFRLAVGATAGETEFSYFPQSSTMSTLRPNRDDDRRNITAFITNSGLTSDIAEMVVGRLDAVEHSTVRVTTLTDIITEHDLKDIGLLKIDVERAELDVLDGLAEELWPRVQAVAIEVHDIDGALGKVVGILSSRGFGVHVHQWPALLGGSAHSVTARRH